MDWELRVPQGLPGLWPGGRGFLGREAFPRGLGRKREETSCVLLALRHPFSVGADKQVELSCVCCLSRSRSHASALHGAGVTGLLRFCWSFPDS